MFSILDGRDFFYQWDSNRKLIVDDKNIKQVHFTNTVINNALVGEAYDLEGVWVVDVPNILLQDNLDITVYAFGDNHTKYQKTIEVKSKSKPDDYVYTETEVFDYNNKLSKNFEDYRQLYNSNGNNCFMLYDEEHKEFVLTPIGYLSGTKQFTDFTDYGKYYDSENISTAFYQIGQSLNDMKSNSFKIDYTKLIFMNKDEFVNYPFQKNTVYYINFPCGSAIQDDFCGGDYWCITDENDYLYLYGVYDNIKFFYKGAIYGYQLIKGATPFRKQSDFFYSDVVDDALNEIGNSLLGVEELLASI